MSYLKNIMQEEHRRLQALCQKYMDKIDSLPKGPYLLKNEIKTNICILQAVVTER